jgi:peptidyl-prolyl cis-trans isomerase SDCCAG10
MSEIYVKEPATSGKVIIVTNLGELHLELWARECPKACRNFIQLCVDRYYEGCIFHRIVRDFIIQTGDHTNTGEETRKYIC